MIALALLAGCAATRTAASGDAGAPDAVAAPTGLATPAPPPAPGPRSVLEGPLPALLAADRPTLLAFMTRWCAVCRREQPALEAWARSHADARVVVVVSGSPADDVRALASERRMDAALEVAADPDGALADSLGVTATPALLLFPADAQAPAASVRRVDELPAPRGAPGDPLVPVGDTGSELGTSYDVVVLAAPAAVGAARRDLQDARALVRALEATLSEWRADSEVSLVNARAAAGPVALSPTLRRLVAGAIHVAEQTGGAFDVTWPPLGALWAEASRIGRDPDEAAIAAALAAVGTRHLHLDGDTLRFDHPETRIGLGGVAKGAIVDAAFLLLRERGHRQVVVNIGGDLRTAGRDEAGERRRLQLVDPYRPDAIAAVIEVEDAAVATSGNYLRFVDVGRRHVGHIVDPRTGRPPAFDGSVTVLTRDAAMADALATALFVLGPEEGLAYARRVDGVEAVFVTHDGVRATIPVEASAR